MGVRRGGRISSGEASSFQCSIYSFARARVSHRRSLAPAPRICSHFAHKPRSLFSVKPSLLAASLPSQVIPAPSRLSLLAARLPPARSRTSPPTPPSHLAQLLRAISAAPSTSSPHPSCFQPPRCATFTLEVSLSVLPGVLLRCVTLHRPRSCFVHPPHCTPSHAPRSFIRAHAPWLASRFALPASPFLPRPRPPALPPSSFPHAPSQTPRPPSEPRACSRAAFLLPRSLSLACLSLGTTCLFLFPSRPAPIAPLTSHRTAALSPFVLSSTLLLAPSPRSHPSGRAHQVLASESRSHLFLLAQHHIHCISFPPPPSPSCPGTQATPTCSPSARSFSPRRRR